MDTANSVSSTADKVSLVRGCMGRILNVIVQNEGRTHEIRADDIRDLDDRFKLWVGNIGASHPPRSGLSLESRLLEAPEILLGVSILLDELLETLDDLYAIVSGRRENREIAALDAANYTDDSDSQNSSDGDEGAEAAVQAARDEAQDIRDIASDCIGSLFRIFILIRMATPRDRFRKALQDQRRPFMDQFDVNYIQERYPKLAQPESRWLLERLGRANTYRRQYLRYCREHRERLEERATEAQEGEAQAERPNINQEYQEHQDHTSPSTRASTLDAAQLKVATEALNDGDDADDGMTSSSAASVIGLEAVQGARLRLPTLGDVSGGKHEFECIFCFGLQRIVRERSWKRHADRDLRAYVCTMGKGQCDLEMFGTREAWYEHELQRHRQQWICAVCKKGPFRSSDEFHNHAVLRHAELDEAQVSVLVSVSQSPLRAIPAKDCPFCDEWEQKLRGSLPGINAGGGSDDGTAPRTVVTVDPQQYRRHVGAHLQQLALFAIPRTIGESGEDDRRGSTVAGNAHSGSANTRRAWSSSDRLSFSSARRSVSPLHDTEHGEAPDPKLPNGKLVLWWRHELSTAISEAYEADKARKPGLPGCRRLLLFAVKLRVARAELWLSWRRGLSGRSQKPEYVEDFEHGYKLAEELLERCDHLKINRAGTDPLYIDKLKKDGYELVEILHKVDIYSSLNENHVDGL